MTSVKELHSDAMDLADAADAATRKGNIEEAKELNRQAFEKERESARLVAHRDDLEPTRSILHRSAASLALACGKIEEAKELIKFSLSTKPPVEIEFQLRELLEEISMSQHHQLTDTTLHSNEFQLSLEGRSIGEGFSPVNLLIPRITHLNTLLHQSTDRYLGYDFDKRGGRTKQKVGADLDVYMSVPRAASYAATLRFVTDQSILPEADFAQGVIVDLLDCLDLLISEDITGLQSRIPDISYYNNFVGLVKKIAPDGKDVRSVGFTAPSTDRGERKVILKREVKEIHALLSHDTEQNTAESVEIHGTLLGADAKSRKSHYIEIVDEMSKTHKIQVSPGTMSRIVKPMFEEQVTVIVTRKNRKFFCEEIFPGKAKASPRNQY